MAHDDLVCPPSVSACDHPARCWFYAGFTLSYRDVEDLLAERGLDVSYETVLRWVLKFGRCSPENFAVDARGQHRDGISMRASPRSTASRAGGLARRRWRLVRAIFWRLVAPTQSSLDHQDDGADDPSIVHPRDSVRKQEIPLNPTHLSPGQQKQISHGEASSPRL
jgi:hypothetical protein